MAGTQPGDRRRWFLRRKRSRGFARFSFCFRLVSSAPRFESIFIPVIAFIVLESPQNANPHDPHDRGDPFAQFGELDPDDPEKP